VPRIDGPNPLDVFTRSERFVDLIDSAVWHTLDAVTGRMRGVITVDSIAGIYTEWQLYVTALRDHVGQSFIDAARQTQVAQRDALIAVVSRRNAGVTRATRLYDHRPRAELPRWHRTRW
jgi:hypothetical protein